VPDRSAVPDHAGRARGWLTTLGWAAYLACSWTWCIGMFLPVLLVRDFGLWGFAVFAVPNVVGAAAMGWVVRAGVGPRLFQQHRHAIRAFSEVTILFQVFFVCWLSTANPHLSGSVLLVTLAGAALIAWCWTRGLERLAAGLTWGASLAIAWAAWMTGGLDLPEARPLLPESHLLPLAPVCIFGFGLCPYLDATFHRARRSLTESESRAGFGVGFGGLFAPMILFTLLYAAGFHWVGDPARFRDGASSLAALVSVHVFLQVLFTGFAHATALPQPAPTARGAIGRGAALILFILVMLTVLRAREGAFSSGLSTGELIYRLFMAFYGLVFPAYVWLCMIPTRDGHAGPRRDKVRVWLFSVGVAAPMFWMGFIERQTWWLAPGLGVVLLARVFLPRSASKAHQ
jgi:hypothetical protein